jgi:hypothetical protein
MAPDRRLAVANAMKSMIETPGWELLDQHVSELHESLLAEIETSKDSHDIRGLAGRLTGIKDLRYFVLTCLQMAEQAAQEEKSQRSDGADRPL